MTTKPYLAGLSLLAASSAGDNTEVSTLLPDADVNFADDVSMGECVKNKSCMCVCIICVRTFVTPRVMPHVSGTNLYSLRCVYACPICVHYDVCVHAPFVFITMCVCVCVCVCDVGAYVE